MEKCASFISIYLKRKSDFILEKKKKCLFQKWWTQRGKKKKKERKEREDGRRVYFISDRLKISVAVFSDRVILIL